VSGYAPLAGATFTGDVTFGTSQAFFGANDKVDFTDSTNMYTFYADGTAGAGNIDANNVTTTTVRASATNDVSLSSTAHGFQIGPSTGANLRMDNGEIMAVDNGAAASLILNTQGGNVTISDTSSYVYVPGAYGNDITTTRHAMWISSAGQLGWASSSRTKKQDIVKAVIDTEAVLSIEPKHFRYIAAVERDGEAAPVEAGFIAEDLHDAGLTDFVDYTEEGDVQGVHYTMYVVALQAVAREQAAQIAALTARVAALEGK
jgi:hypothetical protein